MSNNEKRGSAIAQIVTTVIVALLVGGTAPWWWNKFIDNNHPIPLPSPTPTTPVTPTNTSLSTPLPSQRTSINVAYPGDYFGCNLPVSIQIGDQKVYPQGNFYEVNSVEVGQQPYQINGQIRCLAIGNCQVYGKGFIEVVPRRTYNLYWQNTSLGQCEATLQ